MNIKQAIYIYDATESHLLYSQCSVNSPDCNLQRLKSLTTIQHKREPNWIMSLPGLRDVYECVIWSEVLARHTDRLSFCDHNYVLSIYSDFCWERVALLYIQGVVNVFLLKFKFRRVPWILTCSTAHCILLLSICWLFHLKSFEHFLRKIIAKDSQMKIWAF